MISPMTPPGTRVVCIDAKPHNRYEPRYDSDIDGSEGLVEGDQYTVDKIIDPKCGFYVVTLAGISGNYVVDSLKLACQWGRRFLKRMLYGLGPITILIGATSFGSHAGPLIIDPSMAASPSRLNGIPRLASTFAARKISINLSIRSNHFIDGGTSPEALLIATPLMGNDPITFRDLASHLALWNAIHIPFPKKYASETDSSENISTLVPANSDSFFTNSVSGLAFIVLGSLNFANSSWASDARALASAIWFLAASASADSRAAST